MEESGRSLRTRLALNIIRAALPICLAAAGACAASSDDSAQVSAGRGGSSAGIANDADVATRAAGDGNAAAAASPSDRRTIVFAGTSLTAGLGLETEQAYPHLVQLKIDSAGLPWNVVNAGVSGETSSSLLRRMPWLLRQPFDVIVIETGANDGLRGIPVEAMERNIQSIIDTVRAARPDARMVLAQMEAPPNLGVSYTNRFRRVFPELARRNDIHLLPFLLEGVAGNRELNQGDGIHPNVRGEQIVAENVWRGLRPVLR